MAWLEGVIGGLGDYRSFHYFSGLRGSRGTLYLELMWVAGFWSVCRGVEPGRGLWVFGEAAGIFRYFGLRDVRHFVRLQLNELQYAGVSKYAQAQSRGGGLGVVRGIWGEDSLFFRVWDCTGFHWCGVVFPNFRVFRM